MTIKTLLDERRLVSRVLRHWDERSSDRRFPSKTDIDPWLVGTDWASCMLLALEPDHSTFIVVGANLLPAGDDALDGKPTAACPEDTLVHTLLKHLPQCLASEGPLSIAGTSHHLGGRVLYRSVLLPLSDGGDKIDGMLIAANYRELRAGEEKTLRTRHEVVMLGVKKGQIWEIFDPMVGGWDRVVVLAIENDQATLRSKSHFRKQTRPVSEMTEHPERFRFISHA
jgi:hypothetical protein